MLSISDCKKLIIKNKYLEKNYSDSDIKDLFDEEFDFKNDGKSFQEMLNDLRLETNKSDPQLRKNKQNSNKNLDTSIKSIKSDSYINQKEIFEKEKKNLILKILVYDFSNDIFVINDHKKAFRNSFIFFKTMIQKKKLTLSSLKNLKSLIVLDKNGNQSNNQEIILDPLEPYQIFPSFMSIDFMLNDEIVEDQNKIDAMFEKIDDNNIKIRFKLTNEESQIEEKDTQIIIRLSKMLKYFSDQKYAHFQVNDIENCRNLLIENCAGFNYYAKKIYDEFIGYFTSPVYDKPKGVLFYGPPRTGKTYSSKKIIEYLKLFRIYYDLAAGDFKKPLQGQSEQMINKITERCDVLPWELCILFIDEIDGLCPVRKENGVSESSVNIISVLLSVMDGNKTKKNLLVMGTSNRLKEMDPAFLQRMDIKLFIGLPNTIARIDWIDRVINQSNNDMLVEGDRIDNKFLSNVKSLMKVELKEEITGWTLNFTADAMKKSISQIMTKIVQIKKLWTKNKNEIYQNLSSICYKNLERISNNDKIFISNYSPPSLVRELSNNAEEYSNFPFKIFNEKNSNYTGRALIDFQEHKNETFQFELRGKVKISPDHLELLDDIKKYLDIYKTKYSSQEIKTYEVMCFQLYDQFKNKFKDFYDEDKLGLKELFQSNKNHDKVDQISSFFNQFINEDFYNKLQQDAEENKIKSFGLPKFKITKEEVLKILTKMAILANSNYILVIDSAYFMKNNIMSDEAMAAELIMACEEAIQYDSCLVVIDLNCADISRSYSNLRKELAHSTPLGYMNEKDDISFSYNYNRNNFLRAALEFLNLQYKTNSDKNHWFVALSNNNKITLDFKEKTNWPSTNQQKKVERLIQLDNLSHVCDYCGEIYKKKDNDPNLCSRHHSNYLYDEDYVNMLKEIKKNDLAYNPFEDRTKQDLILFVRDEILHQLEDHPEMKISKFKWMCCGKNFWENGEIKSEHKSKGLYQQKFN